MKIVFAYKGRYHVRDTVIIETLSSMAKIKGFQTDIIYDQDLFGVTDNVYSNQYLNYLITNNHRNVKKIIASRPDIVVFLDNFNRRHWNKDIHHRIKKYPFHTLLINQLGKFETNDYDYVLNGEAEQVFQQFINVFSDSKSFPPVFWDKNLVDLNGLPIPDKSLFENHINFQNSYMIYASKGCPASCSYCEETLFKTRYSNKYFRLRSPDHIINELIHAKNRYQIKEVIFKDAVLTVNDRWLKELLNLYQQKIQVPYKCFGKVDYFNQSTAKMLKDSGCYCIEFGLQTINDHLRTNILHRKEKRDSYYHAFSICDQIKLQYDIDHMFGIPGESIQDHIDASHVYNQLKNLNRVKCHNLVFYENSPILNLTSQDIHDDNSDFFSGTAGKGKMKRINKTFQKYYKMLPLFRHKTMNQLFFKNHNWKICHYIPNIMILLCQIILALKNKDRRFFFYLRYYPLKIKKAFS
jgi:radical SAM superfamily enzyme YgiQ (UPF0313 family)